MKRSMRRRSVFLGACLLAAGAVVTKAEPSSPLVLADPTGLIGHQFGNGLAATAQHLFVGDPRSHELGDSGVVWVFRRGRDGGEAIRPPAGASVRSFGAALAAQQHLLVVGAPGSPLVGSRDLGEVFVYRWRRGR